MALSRSRWSGGAADASSPQTWNRYGYVENQPCNSIDQFGLDSCKFNVQINNDVSLGPAQLISLEATIEPGVLGHAQSERGFCGAQL